MWYCKADYVLINLLIQRRTYDLDQLLSKMLASAKQPVEVLSTITEYNDQEIAFYMRHVLRDAPLHDHALVDRLIYVMGHSFLHAVVACDFVRYGSTKASHYRIQSLVHSETQPESLLEWLLDHTLANLDTEIHSRLKRILSFNAMMGSEMGWQRLCKLHRYIAQECLHIMNRLLDFNMCSIPSSYMPNDHPHIKSLIENSRIVGRITPTLVYASSHWSYHASFVPWDKSQVFIIQAIAFLEHHALHWLESLSLTGENASHTLRPMSESQVSTSILTHD